MKEPINNNLMQGLVSVIVPVYNSEQYLFRCLESIINQSYKNIEIIVINDGSTDNGGKICDDYAFKDKRVKVIHTGNKGPSAARNSGLKISRGEFIFFLDSDDFVENKAISLLIERYYQHKADIIIGNFKKIRNSIIEKRADIIFSNNEFLNKQEILDYSRRYLKMPNKYLLFAFSWGRLFKSSIIKDNHIFFNGDLYTFEDVAFNFDYLNYANGVYFLREPIYNHTVYDNYSSATMTVSGNSKKLFGYKQALFDNISRYLKKKIPAVDIKKEVGHAYIYLTIIQLVRICGQFNNSNRKKIYNLINEVINDSVLRSNLRFYSSLKGGTKIIPVLIKLNLIWPIILICRYKANKRYKLRKK